MYSVNDTPYKASSTSTGKPELDILASEVGCPIRKSTDQSLFAAPRSLSQRTTSFIASCHQGIHQMPLSRLIALIINARFTAITDRRKNQIMRDRPITVLGKYSPPSGSLLRGTGISPLHDENDHTTVTPGRGSELFLSNLCGNVPTNENLRSWWSQTGSNRRPQACKASALPTELWPHLSRSTNHQSDGGPG